jgi:lysophospholipase L1-like esterase
VALLCGALCLVLIPAEIVLRVTFTMSENAQKRDANERARIGKNKPLCTMAADEPLIYRLRPGNCGANSRGYREKDYPLAKPEGIFRIAVLGDSIAAGSGVKRKQQFGRVLQRLLQADNLPIEILTFAISGYSTIQELVVLEQDIFAYEPDLILLSYVLNDPAHPVYHDPNSALGEYYHRPTSYLWHYFARKRFAFRETQRKKRCPDEYHAMLHCVYAAEVEANLTRFANLVREKQHDALVVIHPVLRQQDADLAGVHAGLREILAKLDLPYLDLAQVFDEQTILSHRQDADDPWHPTAEGHRAIAAEIRKFLVGAYMGMPRVPSPD